MRTQICINVCMCLQLLGTFLLFSIPIALFLFLTCVWFVYLLSDRTHVNRNKTKSLRNDANTECRNVTNGNK